MDVPFKDVPVKKVGETIGGERFVILKKQKQKPPQKELQAWIDCPFCGREHQVKEYQRTKNTRKKLWRCEEVGQSINFTSNKGQKWLDNHLHTVKRNEKTEKLEPPEEVPEEAPETVIPEEVETGGNELLDLIRGLREG